MKIINDIRDFFSVDILLYSEKAKAKKNYENMNNQLVQLKKVSEVLKIHDTEYKDEKLESWVYIKKNCFVESIIEILASKEPTH